MGVHAVPNSLQYRDPVYCSDHKLELRTGSFCLAFHQQMKEYFVVNFGAGVREDDDLGERQWKFGHFGCFDLGYGLGLVWGECSIFLLL